MGQRVLVTGGTGYIGSWLSAYLAQKGYEVIVLGRFYPEDKYEAWYSLMSEVLVLDAGDEKFFSAVAERSFDAIIHLISLGDPQSEINPNAVFSINTMPTWQLLEDFSRQGSGRFIYFSTQKVLGLIPPITIDESYIPRPVGKYGLTKLLSEHIVNHYNETTDLLGVNLRLSSAYGSPVFTGSKGWQYVINGLCKTAFEKQEIRLLSDGSPLLDFIHISDVCRATEALLRVENVKNLYYLASGCTLTVLEAAHEVQHEYRKRYGVDIPVIFPNGDISINSNRYKDIARYNISTQRLENIDMQAIVSLQEGIHEIFDYLDNEQ